tara:strand:+ start:325 stop:747 length:423 start_codon:yes stop_codon:yes gene_type:complete
MKKADLKKLIKPLVKECIHEVLIEEGVLSNVVSEVAKGMQTNVVVESKKQDEQLFNEDLQMKRSQEEGRLKLQEHRKKLLEAVSTDAYNGVDLFEGTTPMAAQSEPNAGSVDLGDPGSSGVDISSLMGGASQVWKQMNRK